MTGSRDDILHPATNEYDAEFPSAPEQWTPDSACQIAAGYEIDLDEDHWTVIRALQEYYIRHDGRVNVRELLDALDEKFHNKGGLKYLYRLLPGGPVVQGCALAGLQPPPGAVDKGFGSVQ